MKYIVVYISIVLLLLPAKLLAQKQFIDLLPSAGHQVPSETLIDTAAVNDSVVIIPSEGEWPAVRGTVTDEKNSKKEASIPAPRQKISLQKSLIRGILQPVRIIKAFRILVYVSELKS